MDQRFSKAYYDFAAALLREASSGAPDVMLSPLSVSLALAMCANGAEGKAQEEILKAIGGELPLKKYNELLHAFVEGLPSEEDARFFFADSIWFQEGLRIKKRFRNKNERLYRAEIESLPFDDAAKDRINAWVCEKTDGMIPDIVDHLSPECLMVLVNALAFEAKWAVPFEKSRVQSHVFTGIHGETKDVAGMFSTERISFFADDAKGFFKPYAGGKYSFLAVLPEEGTDFTAFTQNLTGEKLLSYMSCLKQRDTDIMIPKFLLDYAEMLNAALIKMGMMTAFSADADFNKISNTPLTIGEVLHKTHIEVDEDGTKAAAATAVLMKMMAFTAPEQNPAIYLDRPFIFMITDNQSALPLFIGAVASPEPLAAFEDDQPELELKL